MSPKVVIGNWKMNGSTVQVRAFAEAAAHGWPGCEAVLCLPHPLLPAAQAAFGATPMRWGAQDCSGEEEGAFTGEVSARMIREFGARYVIVGHSESRAGHGETDGQVVGKVQRALAAGLTPVVCIGESAEERDGEQTAMVLRRQLLQLVRALGKELAAIVVAYEPLWAIGSGDTAAPGIIEHTHEFIAATLAFHAGPAANTVRILYGGSVNPRNACAILSRKPVDGVLVGGASLVPADFMEIGKAAARCSAVENSEAA